MRTSFLIILLTAVLLPQTLSAQDTTDKSERGQKRQREQNAEPKQRGLSQQRGQQRRSRWQMDPAKLFRRIDQNQDGVIVPDEVPERMRKRMALGDTNSDGKIDSEEFNTHIEEVMKRRGQQSLRSNGELKRRGQKGKNKGDRKGKGQGKPGKRGQGGLSIRQPENLTAELVMSKLDRDGNGELEKSEMPKMMASKLVRIDSDGNESVNITELRSAIEILKAKAMDSGKGRYSTNPESSKGQVPKRPDSASKSK